MKDWITESIIEKIKLNVINDKQILDGKFKIRSKSEEVVSVSHSEREMYESRGFTVVKSGKNKVKLSREWNCGTKFEHDIWCMFYKLNFKILNRDEQLKIQWGSNLTQTQQIDILAVGEDAIFVVECKASSTERKKANFKDDLEKMSLYMDGVSSVLRKCFGKDKKVKFIFATRNYVFDENSNDKKRMEEMGVFHLDNNTYDYINNLIKSYKDAVIYQFYGLLFKDELINEETYVIPALKGKMGEQNYYLFSIEPSKLLKIGFVLHRTRVNDFSAPTYQRLLLPNRLAGIKEFINGGGYFPNSVIVNFRNNVENIRLEFEELGETQDADVMCGLLKIPRAYGIAYIIDGQHRIYGYASTNAIDSSTIPVVAFEGMEPQEQLKIFMEINENQKAVSASLRLDLEEDLLWDAPRLDSRIKALRSSVIRRLTTTESSFLFNKIDKGEDKGDAGLTFKPFNLALSDSGLVPSAKGNKFIAHEDTCLYDTLNQDTTRAMDKSRDDLRRFISRVYYIFDEFLHESKKDFFIYRNNATYAIIVLAGSLNTYLISIGKIDNRKTSIEERLSLLQPYFVALAKGLNDVTPEEQTEILKYKGGAADKFWLRFYQKIVNRAFPDFNPDGLQQWLEEQDQSVQNEGKELNDNILDDLKRITFNCLKKTFGEDKYKNNSAYLTVKNECERDIINAQGSLEDIKWEDQLTFVHLKDIISENFSYEQFTNVFSIQYDKDQKFKSKKDKLQWLEILISKTLKNKKFSKSEIDKLGLIKQLLLQNEMNYVQ